MNWVSLVSGIVVLVSTLVGALAYFLVEPYNFELGIFLWIFTAGFTFNSIIEWVSGD